MKPTYSLFFKDAKPEQLESLGGKGKSLASMSQADLPVPQGFCVTTDAFVAFIQDLMTAKGLFASLAKLDTKNMGSLDKLSGEIRSQILNKTIAADIQEDILASYRSLCEMYGKEGDLPVAVRSSATAEDLPDASFAGQQDTYLWVVGEDEVLSHIKMCWASLYTSRAIAYRKDHNIPEEDIHMSVVVQKMVNARVAGVTMTLNPTNGDRTKIAIEASYGLGESVVSGTVTPDNYLMDKVIFELVESSIQDKKIALIPDPANKRVIEIEVDPVKATEACLTRDELIFISKIAKRIEKHYGCPQDIEWALDADAEGEEAFTLLQSRPETVWSNKKTETKKHYMSGMQGLVGSLINPLSAKK
ncbi:MULTISPECIES: PEP/pyruvate-binding domain-containing protein [Mongoliitalea]|jgi:pyruvate, water dikinase|uniref:Phosphoenolpyruvate synthase n=1 Tax=Mongoliitalea lutea TaxID=849756 RepID=A0A8J3CVI3_9BACT|nr:MULTISPECIES: PEP/pyruvate-binding domain-containing protein [Mongoliitalea]UJP64951.1 PEP/pyruvate-binding domain-containing protein [Mongoliitalea daihaiensis]GHB34606.1 phosphoenolpyruvate synthase [Mongoliitalea lutea]